jgi:putative transport protein
VVSIGLQVGPGFFQSFKSGGLKLNLLATLLVLMAVLAAYLIHVFTGEDLMTMVGVMSGAVTNTPGLGAAQQTVIDSMGQAEGGEISGNLASAYAVAYPIGVLGVLALLMIFKSAFKVDLAKEQAALDALNSDAGDSAVRVYCAVSNPALYGKSLRDVVKSELMNEAIISRLLRDGKEFMPTQDTVFQEGDRLLVVTSHKNIDKVKVVFGEEVQMHFKDWTEGEENLIFKRLSVTNSKLTGRKVKSLNFRVLYGVSVTRVVRAGLELVATGELTLQLGDVIQVVGPEKGIEEVARTVGNKVSVLNKPNMIPIFAGIVFGVLLGCIPIAIPGLPQPVKLGLAGGPLIVAILIGCFGPRLGITTYTTMSANMMLREVGITIFMAAVGLGAGRNFVASLLGGGWWWILYGAIITIIPVLIIGLLGRYVFKLNFYQICGLVSGGTTDPAVLAFAQNAYGTDYTSVNYATVYPLTMFLRVLMAQILVLIALA